MCAILSQSCQESVTKVSGMASAGWRTSPAIHRPYILAEIMMKNTLNIRVVHDIEWNVDFVADRTPGRGTGETRWHT